MISLDIMAHIPIIGAETIGKGASFRNGEEGGNLVSSPVPFFFRAKGGMQRASHGEGAWYPLIVIENSKLHNDIPVCPSW